jgi:hypothetical protein
MYDLGDTSICLECDVSNCSECNDDNSCHECNEGFYISGLTESDY